MTTGALATTASVADAATEPRPRHVLRAWFTVLAVVAARAAVAFFGTLVVAALVPVVSSWDGFVVTSGSMEPRISVGDVVLGQPMGEEDPVDPGRVFVFTDPADPAGDRLLVHRVVERRPGGRWTTAGDANASFDVEPAPRSAFQARAVVLVPLVGDPVIWWRERRLGPLIAWGIVAAVALAIVLTVRPHSGGGGTGSGRARRSGGRRRAERRRLAAVGRYAVVLPVVGLTVGLVTAPALGTASSAFTATSRNPGNSWSVSGEWQQPYSSAVLADDPHFYYLLDEANGPALADSSDNGRHGAANGATTFRTAGALPGNPGYSVDLAGGARLVSGGAALVNPTTFSLELWFRTSSSAGGKLIGFESGTGSTSLSFDRHVTLRNDGRLVYGDWATTPYRAVSTPAAYNDGQWHHLVLTAVPRSGSQQDVIIYVDGEAVAAGAASRTASYSGWWRVGAGRAGALGATTGFPGRVDQVAVYRTALSAGRVAAHYAAR